MMSDETPRLNVLNWLNPVFYVLNALFTYGVGTLGWLGNGTNEELSEKYQTLVTPKGTAFIIWAVIFLTQAVYCILQLVPRFRGKAMVQNGVGYYYIATCIFQVSWTLAFAYEVFWLSQIFIVLIWGSLVALLYSQYFVESEGTLLEFWLLRFPFAIHCGWLTAATALNANVLFVEQDSPADIQLAVAIISLAVLHAISVWVLFGIRKANYTIAGVLSWANGWIYAELQSPRDSIVALFSTDAISGVSYAAVAVAFIILAQIVARVIIDLIKKCRGGKGREDVESTVSSKALLSSESEA